MPIRIFVVDPFEVMRAGIRLVCSKQHDMEIIGEAASLTSAMSAIAHQAPDVLIIDLEPLGESAAMLIKQAKAILPDCRILVYTNQDRPDMAQATLNAGAQGFLIKAARLDEIAVAVRSLFDGRIFISHSAASPSPGIHVRPHFPPRSFGADPVSGDALSRREREVVSMVADGLTNKQIASKLFLSIKTIETYRARVMRKHGLNDRSDLIQFARQAGLCEKAS